MTISFIAATVANEASSTSIAVAKPSGTAEDDMIITLISTTNNNVSTLAGWTKILDLDDAGGNFDAELFYKVAGGSEPSSYTWAISASATHDYSCAASITLRGTHLTPTLVVGSLATGDSTAPQATSVTAPRRTDFLVQAQAAGETTGSTYTSSPASGMTERADRTRFVTSTVDCHAMLATEQLSAAGATGTRTTTLSSARPWGTILVAVPVPLTTTMKMII